MKIAQNTKGIKKLRTALKTNRTDKSSKNKKQKQKNSKSKS